MDWGLGGSRWGGPGWDNEVLGGPRYLGDPRSTFRRIAVRMRKERPREFEAVPLTPCRGAGSPLRREALGQRNRSTYASMDGTARAVPTRWKNSLLVGSHSAITVPTCSTWATITAKMIIAG